METDFLETLKLNHSAKKSGKYDKIKIREAKNGTVRNKKKEKRIGD